MRKSECSPGIFFIPGGRCPLAWQRRGEGCNNSDSAIMYNSSLQCRRISAGRVDIPIGCSGRNLSGESKMEA